jgi:hypothetical protein
MEIPNNGKIQLLCHHRFFFECQTNCVLRFCRHCLLFDLMHKDSVEGSFLSGEIDYLNEWMKIKLLSMIDYVCCVSFTVEGNTSSCTLSIANTALCYILRCHTYDLARRSKSQSGTKSGESIQSIRS